jgi:hypothetical protein
MSRSGSRDQLQQQNIKMAAFFKMGAFKKMAALLKWWPNSNWRTGTK